MGRRPLISVCVDALAWEAHRLLEEQRINHLVVLDDGRAVGILCACDLRDAPAGSDVARCMSHPVTSVAFDAPVDEAVRRMRASTLGCLPVTRHRDVIGVVTRGDLLRMGVSPEALGIHVCTSCGGTHHVRPFRDVTDLFFCVECLDFSPDAELGVGD